MRRPPCMVGNPFWVLNQRPEGMGKILKRAQAPYTPFRRITIRFP